MGNWDWGLPFECHCCLAQTWHPRHDRFVLRFGRLDQRDATDFDGFFAPDRTDSFASFRFQTDLQRANAEDARDAMAHGVEVVGQFGSLGVNHAVNVDDTIANSGDFLGSDRQHFGRVAAAVGFLRVRKQLADIGQGGSAEQRVGDGVEQHIGITMADELPIVRHQDTTQK